MKTFFRLLLPRIFGRRFKISFGHMTLIKYRRRFYVLKTCDRKFRKGQEVYFADMDTIARVEDTEP